MISAALPIKKLGGAAPKPLEAVREDRVWAEPSSEGILMTRLAFLVNDVRYQ